MLELKVKRKRKKAKSKVILFVLTIILFLGFATPAYSQYSILTTSSQKISATEAWWNQLWESTFNPPPLIEDTEESTTSPETEPIISILPPAPAEITTVNLPGSVPDLVPVPNVPVPTRNSSGSLPEPPPPFTAQRGTNLSIYAFASATRTIMAIALIFWLFSYGRALVESPTLAQSVYTFTKLFIPIAISLMFISNQGHYSRVLALGMRGMVNSWSNGVLNLSITDYTMRAAIQDQLITEAAKKRIGNEYKTCQNINPPEVALPSLERPDSTDPNIPPISEALRKNYDYLDCLERVKESAQELLIKAENDRACGDILCKSFRYAADKLYNAIDILDAAERERKINNGETDPALIGLARATILGFGIANPTVAPLAFGAATKLTDPQIAGALEDLGNVVISFANPGHEFLYFTQWMWVSTLEMAMFINGLFAPMFFAVSMIPGKERMVNLFLIEFLTIGLAKMAYMVIIGIVAIQLSSSDTGFIDDTFFLSMGIFAPAVSFAVVTVGGLAAASSYKSQSVGAAAAVGGLVSSGAATIAYSMTRAADKRR